jgi:hypothetical protein
MKELPIKADGDHGEFDGIMEHNWGSLAKDLGQEMRDYAAIEIATGYIDRVSFHQLYNAETGKKLARTRILLANEGTNIGTRGFRNASEMRGYIEGMIEARSC